MPQVFLNGRFLETSHSAVNTVARDLSIALGRNPGRWSVTLAVPRSLGRTARETGLPVREIGQLDGIAWEQSELPALREEGVIAGFFNTVPWRGLGYVTMLHDAQVFTAPQSYSPLVRLWRRALLRRAACDGNFILTISEHSKRALLGLGLGHESRIGVVPNGLGAVGSVTPDTSTLIAHGLRPGAYCIAVANVLPHKNLALLLETFEHPALSDLQLVLVGHTTRDEVEATGALIPPNVVFTGHVSDARLAALYRGALSVLVPSFEEGFGLPALEGMAHGAAALVSDRAALPETVGSAGIVLPASDAGAWIRTLCDLRGDPDLQNRLAAAGRSRAADFTWDAAARRARHHLDRWFPEPAHRSVAVWA